MSAKTEKYAGERIKTEDLRKGRVPVERWKPKIRYAWSTGTAMTRFLKELKQGRIIARKCNICGRIMVPPRMYCELCFRPTDEWVYIKDTGIINTYSISYLAADAKRLKEPIFIAIIELDGATKGMGIFHLIGEAKKENINFGMKVKAVWKPLGERIGAITDIRYFKPMEE